MDRRLAPAAPAGLLRISRIALSLILVTSALMRLGGNGRLRLQRCGVDAGLHRRSPPQRAPSGLHRRPSAQSVHASATAPSAGARVLAATAVVRRFCHLVDQHRYAAARRLLTGPSVWPLRELRAVRRMGFESAQAWGGPADDEVTLLVGFTATVTWRSPLTDGINDVFFTLTRRVTTGEWLIAAVSTSP